MSTLKENKIFSTENVLCSIYFVVQKEKLGDVVKRIREDNGWSLATVRKQSGFKLATSYINRIENNQIDAEALSIAKTQALAKGLKTSEDFIFAVARGVSVSENLVALELTTYLAELPEARQIDLLDIAKTFSRRFDAERSLESAELISREQAAKRRGESEDRSLETAITYKGKRKKEAS